MRFKLENNKFDKESQKRMDESLGLDVEELQSFVGGSVGAEEMVSEDMEYLYGEPGSFVRRKQVFDQTSEESPARPCLDSTAHKVYVFHEGFDTKEYKKRYADYVKKLKQKVDDFLQPGDDALRDVIYAGGINQAENAIKGWTINKLDMRLNSRFLAYNFKTSVPVAFNDKTREDIRILDEKYPISRAMVENDKAIQRHIEYFDALDNGTLTLEQDLELRKAILAHEQKMLDAYEKMDTVKPHSPEAAEINKHMSNYVETLTRHGLRGLGRMRADTEARVTGLRNGWAIEDLNALSHFKIVREGIYSEAYYNRSTGEPLEKPVFKEGERDYLNRLEKTWNKIETTVVRTEEERKALLTEMRGLVREGYDRKFISKNGDGFEMGMYTFDRILERKLPQEEKDLMGSDALGQMIEQFDAERQAAANNVHQQPAQAPQAADEEAQERENRLFNLNGMKDRWFYDELEQERKAATAASGELTRPLSAYSDMIRYFMAEKGLSFAEAVELEKGSDEERKALATEFYRAYAAHPVKDNGLPQSVVEDSAAWYGDIDAKAIKNILSKPLPAFDPRNIDDLKALATQQSELGLMAHFVMDYTQDITNIMSVSVMNRKGEAAYLDAFGGRAEYARMQGQLQVINQLQDLAAIVTNPKQPVHVQALALAYLENIHKSIKDKKLEDVDPGLWDYLRSVSLALRDGEDEKRFLKEGAPSYAAMKAYLEGKGPSPFSEEYLNNNVDKYVNEWMASEANTEVKKMFGSYTKPEIDFARVYNLDFISLRETEQKDLSAEDIKGFSDKQKKDIHTCFQQLLGPMISSYTFQADLAVMLKEDPMDRYRINGRKISQIVRDKYPGLEGKDKETAMEALLLEAMADAGAELSFVALEYDKSLSIVEQAPRILPKAKPHMENMSSVQPLTETQQAEANYDAIKRGTAQLNAFMPGVFRSFGPDYLDAQLDRVRELGSDFIIDGLEPEEYAKKGYSDRFTADAGALAVGLEKQGRAQEAAFVRYQSERTKALLGLGGNAGNYAVSLLNALTDKLDLAAGAKHTPSEVFKGLKDFPLIDAAKTANEIQNIENTMRTQPADELRATEENNRKILIEKMNLLETQIRSLRSNIAKGNTRGTVEGIFSDPKEVDRFINGCPGSKTLLTELSAKKNALANGWPVRDADLIASFYVKRELLKTAAESKVPGSTDRLKYERAFRAVNEICKHIDEHPITNAQERTDVFKFINSYGNALYNDTVATAGLADKGQLALLKTQVNEAMKATVDPALFYSAEKQEELKALLPPAPPAADAEVIYEAYAQPFYQMDPEEHTKPISDEKYIQAETAKAVKIREQLQNIKPVTVDEDLPSAKRDAEMLKYTNVQNLRLADIKKQEKGRLYVNADCELLEDMLDSLDLNKGADTVFGTLANEAGVGAPFPLMDAVNAARDLNERMRTALKFSAQGKADPNDFNTKMDLLTSIEQLENKIKEMRLNAAELNREEELSKVFTSPDAVKNFVNGTPGSKMILADLAGRKMAITMGWPVEDMDLISSFYVKRQLLKDAMADKPQESREYRDLEKAYNTMDDICRHVESHVIMSAGDRLDALNNIHAHGTGLYNETAANAGQPDKGQLYTLKAEMKKAMSHTPTAASFKNLDQLTAFYEKAGQIERDIPEVFFNTGEYSAEYVQNRNAFEAQLEEQELSEALLDLFEHDEDFYKTGSVPTLQEAEANSEKAWDAKLLRTQAPGYFDTPEVLDRLEQINTTKTPGMLKKDAPARMMDDMRTYYLGKGSCTYTLTEPELDAYGNPVRDEKGAVKTVKTEHTLTFNNFDDVLELNRLPMEARRQLADAYMSDLEQHPFGPDVDEATAEANVRYYASIHKSALQKIKLSDYEGIDFNGPEDIEKLARGGSKLFLKTVFAQDYIQNTEMFTQFDPSGEINRRNRLREAYLDEFGGMVENARLRDPQDILQGMKMLAMVVTSDKIYSLQQRALARHCLQELDARMVIPGALQPGATIDTIAMAGFLLDPKQALPDKDIPKDEELIAYLEGKANSPFKKPYLDILDAKLKENRANEAIQEAVYHRDAIGIVDTSPIFDMSYIQMPRQTKDQRGILTAVPQTWPDLNALTDAQKKETLKTYDRVLGHLTGRSRSGKQYDYCIRKGEKLTDRFRIDGKKPLEYLAANGYPAIAQNADAKELDTIIKAAIMTAMADPSKKVSFVPYMMDKNGNQVEDKPIALDAKVTMSDLGTERNYIRAPFPDNEGAKYYAALFKMTCSFVAITSFDPSVDYKNLIPNETAKEAMKDQRHGTESTGLYENLYYDIAGYDSPIGGIEFMKFWSTMYAKEKTVQHNFLRGTQEDGSLNAEGKKNLAAVKEFFTATKNKLNEIADKWEKTNPVYAEYIRLHTDHLRTAEDGFTWLDMEFGNNLYMNTLGQLAGLSAPGLDNIDAGAPEYSNDMLLACMGYPSGNPSFRLPQAMFAARRSTLVMSEHDRMRKEGTLTKTQDRLLRTMMLSEMDELEKQLRRVDDLALKSKIPGTPEAQYCEKMEDDSEHPKYFNNSAFEASQYFPRGTYEDWQDMQGKRAMLANGWPIEDINTLSLLYVNRADKKNTVDKYRKLNGEKWAEEMLREIKTLDEVIKKLEETPITNAADRQKMLEYMDGYGDLFYRAAGADSGGPNERDEMRDRIKRLSDRKPSPEEFLSPQELEEARAEYQRYQTRKNSANPDTPTVSGPQTDIERSFLNVERIGNLLTMQGRLSKEGLSSDPVHGKTLTDMNNYLAKVNDFYRNTAYLDPANAAQRNAAFDRLVKDSKGLVEQVGRSISKIDNGSGRKLSDKEQRVLDSFTAMQDQIRHMRSAHTASIDFEIKRKVDLHKEEQENARKQQEAQAKQQQAEALRQYLVQNHFAEENGKLYVHRDHLLALDPVHGAEIQEYYKNNVPEVLEVVNIDGKPRVEAVHTEMEKRREEAKKAARKKIADERQKRRDEYAAQDLYAEGAADLFGSDRRRIREERRIEREVAEKLNDVMIGKIRNIPDDDERLKLSVGRIMELAYAEMTDTNNKYTALKDDTSPEKMHEKTELGIAGIQASKRYDKMVCSVTAMLSDTQLLNRIKSKWPEWYETNLAGPMSRLTDPIEIRSKINTKLTENLPVNDRHELLGEICENLHSGDMLRLKKELLESRSLTELDLEEQVSHILHDRVEELKKGLGNNNALNDDEKQEYLDALEYADQFVTASDPSVRNAYFLNRGIEERVSTAVAAKGAEEAFAAIEDEDLKKVVNDLMANGDDFVAYGVSPVLEDGYDKMMQLKLNLSEANLNSFVTMLNMMEDMGLQASDDFPGGTAQSRGFDVVCRTKEELINAVNNGDPQAIIAAKRNYEKARADMDKVFEFLNDGNHFSKYSVAGNIDSVREANVPLEYGKDFYNNSKVNSVHMLYSALKWANISIQEFKDDPNAAIERMTAKNIERCEPETRYRGKSAGELLGEFSKEDSFETADIQSKVAGLQLTITRIEEALAFMDEDPERRKMNFRNYKVRDQLRMNQITHHVNNNPFRDKQRKNEVQQLLSIVDMADLENNRARMLTNKPLGADGRPVAKITAADYIAGLDPDYNGYSALSLRAEEILADAVKTGGEKFDPVAFMANRQAALSMLLIKRAADRGKPGFELLEEEINNTAQYYDSIRAAHPEYAMPELSEEQRKTFEENAKQFKTQLKAAESKLTAEQKHAIEERKNETAIAERQTAQHITELETALKAHEEQFVNSYNQLETMRKTAAAANNNEQVNQVLQQKRAHVSTMRSWLIDEAKAGNITTDYAKKRLAEILALKDTDSAKLPAYGLQDKNAENTHAGHIQHTKEVKELTTRPYEHDEAKLNGLLELDKNEDPVARYNRLQQESRQRIQQAEQEDARQQQEILDENNRRDAKLNVLIPEALTQRLTQRFNERQNAFATTDAMKTAKLDRSEPEAYHAATINENDAEHRFRNMYGEIKASLSADNLLNVLSDTLGTREAAALFGKFKNKVPTANELKILTEDERSHFFAALVASLPNEERDRLIDMDNAYKPIKSYDFSTMPDDSLQDKLNLESQVDHPEAGRVQEILNQAGGNWSKMSGGGTQQELDEFRNVLYEANELMTIARPEVKEAALNLQYADMKRYNSTMDLDHKKGSEKEENRFFQDLYETRNGIVVTKEERAEDVRRTAKTNPKLDPRYVANVAQIMKKMEELQLFKPNAAAEEARKIYSFHKMADAQQAVSEALKADMSVAENRKKLADAVSNMKTVQKETDELMEMAKLTFSKKDYMDNLDNVREDGIPWRYARDRVSASQLNAVWQFGNLLKANNISIDEFAAHPDDMIQKLKTTAIEEATTLKAATRGLSIGEMTAYAANGYYNGVIKSKNVNLMGKYTRGVGGLLEAEPEEYDPERKSRNKYLFTQNIRGYASQFGLSQMSNVLKLKEGFRGKDNNDALKAVMMVPENEFDPDLMMVKVPWNADGSFREPFNFGNYLKAKTGIMAPGEEAAFLTAQQGRLEKILKDADKAQKKMKAEYDKEPTTKDPGINGDSFNLTVYDPFQLVQARQQALMEMLVLKQSQPQYHETPQLKNLEDELLNMAERYETLRKSNPNMVLPELTDEQKKQLETTKKNYLELKNNSEKLMDKLEDQIVKNVKKEEKAFTDGMKELNDKIRKLNERIGRRDEMAPLSREEMQLQKEKERLEKQRENLRVSRMRTLSEQYKDGKLPKKYVEERLKQLDEGRENERLPELFGDPAHNAADKKARSNFLRDNLLNLRGANIDLKQNRKDDPENWKQWTHLFRTEDVFEIIDKNGNVVRPQPAPQPQPVQQPQQIINNEEIIAPQAPGRERRRSVIKLDDMIKAEKDANKENNANKNEPKGRKSVNNKKGDAEVKEDNKLPQNHLPGGKK